MPNTTTRAQHAADLDVPSPAGSVDQARAAWATAATRRRARPLARAVRRGRARAPDRDDDVGTARGRLARSGRGRAGEVPRARPVQPRHETEAEAGQ